MNSFWINGDDRVTEGDWRFSSGGSVPRGTPFWGATTSFQEPNNVDNNEHCLQLRANLLHYMNDCPCSEQIAPLCEQSPQVPFNSTGKCNRKIVLLQKHIK